MIYNPQYLIESSLCLIVFYAFYHIILKRETFFQLNRVYLVLAPIVSFGIPLIHINAIAQNSPKTLEYIVPTLIQINEVESLVWQPLTITPSEYFTIGEFLMFIYLLGVLVMSIKLFRSIFMVVKQIYIAKKLKQTNFTLLHPYEEIKGASFFNYIFLSHKMDESSSKIILEHELVHARQWHTLDILLLELCIIMQWYNPLIYLYKNSLQAVHEYIADDAVCTSCSLTDYARLLVQESKGQHSNRLVNTFNSFTKKRLAMLSKKKSKKWKQFKYLLSFPLLGTLMVLFSFNLLDNMTDNPITELDNYLEKVAEQPLVKLDDDTFKWGKLLVNFKHFNQKNAIEMTPEEFLSLKSTQPNLGQDKVPNLELFWVRKGSDPISCVSPTCFDNLISKVEKGDIFYIDRITLNDKKYPGLVIKII